MRSSRKQINLDKIRKSLTDPVRFTETMLRQKLWSVQKEILHSVATHRRTAVKACHASGKTFGAAAAVLWWITTHGDAIALTSAPTWTQVERVLWGEIHGMVHTAGVKYPRAAATSLHLGPHRYAIGLSTNDAVRLHGYHAEHVLIVLDEAPGILSELFEAIEGIRAGGDVRVLCLGNPTIASGPFHEFFASQRSGWNTITISAFDTPNLEGVTLERLLQMSDAELDENPMPFLTTRRWVREKYGEWGEGHPLWESRVLGNFPTQSEDALVSLTWLEQAKLRTEGDGEVCAGLDVAGPGEDETVLCVRRGPRIVLLKAWSTPDPRGAVVAALAPFRSELKSVNVDAVGIGYYMAQHLRDLKFPVTDVNVGQASSDPARYSNKKAEVYWGFRERAMTGDLAGLTDDKAIAQLASIRYSHNSRGQIVIEPKEDARKRGVKSPDRAEAVILAFGKARFSYQGLMEFYEREIAESRAQKQAQGPGHVFWRENLRWW